MRKFVFITLATVLISGCTSSINKKDIIGTWKVIDFESTVEMQPRLKEVERESTISSIYAFGPETCTWYWGFGGEQKNLKGQWKIQKGSNIIEYKLETAFGKVDKFFEITSYSDTELKWTEKIGTSGEYFVTLEKITEL